MTDICGDNVYKYLLKHTWVGIYCGDPTKSFPTDNPIADEHAMGAHVETLQYEVCTTMPSPDLSLAGLIRFRKTPLPR